MADRWLSAAQQRVWRSYVRLERLLPARLGRELQVTSGLSGPEYEVLVNLSEEPSGRLRPYQLGERMLWEQSRLSHQLTRMHGRGLVTREGCPGDGRGAFVALTPKGWAAIRAAAPPHVDMVRKLVFDQLTDEEATAFGAVCDKILAAISASGSGSGSGDAPDAPQCGGVAERVAMDK